MTAKGSTGLTIQDACHRLVNFSCPRGLYITAFTRPIRGQDDVDVQRIYSVQRWGSLARFVPRSDDHKQTTAASTAPSSGILPPFLEPAAAAAADIRLGVACRLIRDSYNIRLHGAGQRASRTRNAFDAATRPTPRPIFDNSSRGSISRCYVFAHYCQ